MSEDTQLEGVISFWESALESHQWIISPSTRTLIEQTIKYLKELREIKDKLERR